MHGGASCQHFRGRGEWIVELSEFKNSLKQHGKFTCVKMLSVVVCLPVVPLLGGFSKTAWEVDAWDRHCTCVWVIEWDPVFKKVDTKLINICCPQTTRTSKPRDCMWWVSTWNMLCSGCAISFCKHRSFTARKPRRSLLLSQPVQCYCPNIVGNCNTVVGLYQHRKQVNKNIVY